MERGSPTRDGTRRAPRARDPRLDRGCPRSKRLARCSAFSCSAWRSRPLAVPGVASAATFTVTKTPDTLDGSCTPDDCSLREAIEAANADAAADTVILPAGTYPLTLVESGADNDGGDLNIDQSTTLTGAGARVTVIQGNGADRVIDMSSKITVEISGVTITGGGGVQQGAGIFGSGVLTVRDSALVGNSTSRGDDDQQPAGRRHLPERDSGDAGARADREQHGRVDRRRLVRAAGRGRVRKRPGLADERHDRRQHRRRDARRELRASGRGDLRQRRQRDAGQRDRCRQHSRRRRLAGRRHLLQRQDERSPFDRRRQHRRREPRRVLRQRHGDVGRDEPRNRRHRLRLHTAGRRKRRPAARSARRQRRQQRHARARRRRPGDRPRAVRRLPRSRSARLRARGRRRGVRPRGARERSAGRSAVPRSAVRRRRLLRRRPLRSSRRLPPRHRSCER